VTLGLDLALKANFFGFGLGLEAQVLSHGLGLAPCGLVSITDQKMYRERCNVRLSAVHETRLYARFHFLYVSRASCQFDRCAGREDLHTAHYTLVV